MSQPPRPNPAHVPILTEVIEFGADPHTDAPAAYSLLGTPTATPPPTSIPTADTPVLPAIASPLADSGVALPIPSLTPPGPVVMAAPPVLTAAVEPLPPAPLTAPATRLLDASGNVDEALLAQRVLADVQRQIDGMLEYRLRQALTPILARTAEALVRELRQDLSKTMRDVVSRAVAQEMARQRPKG